VRLLKTAAISAFHRLGLFAHLRDSWRAGLGRKGDPHGTLTRSIETAGRSLPANIEELHKQLRRVKRENRTLRTAMAVDQRQRVRWNDLEATLDEARIRSSVERALAAAMFETVPMPHAVLHDVLPAATYDALVEAIPGDEFFPDKDPVKQNLRLQPLDTVPAWTQRGLTYLESTIIESILGPAIVARMQPYLEEIYREEYGPSLGAGVAAVRHAPTAGRLMLRRPGYKLKPHLDPRRVTITCLLYFARPGDNTAYGTELYEVDRPVTVDRSNTFYPGEHGYKCRLVKAVPFRPNSALVFLNRQGLHAAEIPKDAPRDTKRFAYQFYISPDPAALEHLVADTALEGLPLSAAHTE
jgi:hypothetical protein